MTRSEAVSALKIALPRCYGDKVLLSTETAAALGVKGKSITKAEAQKLIDKEPTDSDDDSSESEASGDAAPAKPSRRKATKPADPPAESGATSDPLG